MAARAAERAVSCSDQRASEIHELAVIKELHLRTADELGLDSSIVSGLLSDLEQNLQYIASTKELTPTKQHYLVSFGERISTAIFSAYLNKIGKRTRQYAFDVGFKSPDDFTNSDINEATYPTIAKKLQGDWIEDPAIPIVTSSTGKGCKSCYINTLESDLTATIIAKALGSGEIQMWKLLDGVLTGDPNICTNAMPIANLTFDEACELAYSGAQVLHPQAMRLAIGGGIPIIKVKNSYNSQAPGTVITQTRDMSTSILSSIVLKSNIFMFNIASTGVLCQHDFEAKVFSNFKDQKKYDEATTGSNICLRLDLSKISSLEMIQRKLDSVAEELQKIATVVRQQQSIISLIGNNQKSSFIFAKAFSALDRIGVNAQEVLTRSSNKVLNVSLVVHENEAKHCVQVLHSAFFEDGFVSKVEEADNECPGPVNSSAAAAAVASSSGVKRKANDDHPEAPPSARQERADTDPNGPEETERTTFSDNAGPLGGASAFEVQPGLDGIAEVAEGGCGPGNALDDLEGILFSEDDPMQAGGDNGGYPDECWVRLLEGDDDGVLPVGGGEQVMPEYAPGAAVIEEDAGQGSWTAPDGPKETQHPDNDLTAVSRDDVGDPGEIFLMDEYLQTPIDVQVHEYLQSPIDVDVSGYLVGTSESEPEQLAEGGSGLEVLLGEFSPDELLGPSHF